MGGRELNSSVSEQGQGTFRLHDLIWRISSIGKELLAFTDGPCCVALFLFNPHLSKIHEYFSLLLDPQNRFFFFFRRGVIPTSVIL